MKRLPTLLLTTGLALASLALYLWQAHTEAALPSTVTLSLRVLDAEGYPLAGAEIVQLHELQREEVGVSDAFGSWQGQLAVARGKILELHIKKKSAVALLQASRTYHIGQDQLQDIVRLQATPPRTSRPAQEGYVRLEVAEPYLRRALLDWCQRTGQPVAADGARVLAVHDNEDGHLQVSVELESGKKPPRVSVELESGKKPPRVSVELESGQKPPRVSVELESGQKSPRVSVELESGQKPPRVSVELESGQKSPRVSVELESGQKSPRVSVELESGQKSPRAERVDTPPHDLFSFQVTYRVLRSQATLQKILRGIYAHTARAYTAWYEEEDQRWYVYNPAGFWRLRADAVLVNAQGRQFYSPKTQTRTQHRLGLNAHDGESVCSQRECVVYSAHARQDVY